VAVGFGNDVVLFMVGVLILMLLFPPEQTFLSRSREELKDEFEKLAPMNRGEKATIVVFLFTVVFWLTSGLLEGWLKIRIPISMTVVFTSSLLFIPTVTGIRWARIEGDMSWGSILLLIIFLTILLVSLLKVALPSNSVSATITVLLTIVASVLGAVIIYGINLLVIAV
jgi:sodium-dependent dicarboxylate transporter 2/3/5